MATLRELHGKAGNPDLTHWKDIQLFSIVEAALLTAGIDPLIYECIRDESILIGSLKTNEQSNWKHAAIMIRAIKQAVCTSEIDCKIAFVSRENDYTQWFENITPLNLGLEDLDNIVVHQTKISRKGLEKWLNKNGYIEPMTPAINYAAPISTPQANNHVLISSYSTPALEVAEAVVKHFWVGFDPETMPPPKQETVTSWIRENHPHIEAKQIQDAIDKICRHPSAKKGGVKLLRQIKDITH
ncbi:hypothetical protein [Aquirhabdus parva]|uniref:Uncharacterized protein n=1 Tax=Aquirhabdus parva TaxID=2283318 RepID=A0A345P5P7_9GAMM|nr:hypothetical protein [Aquirhabdus parva]AXI02606.1 hypothetical protein HYN46_07055 [Aquirhabdus parva]